MLTASCFMISQGEVLARLVVHAASSSKLEQKCINLAQSPKASLTLQALYNVKEKLS